MITSVAAMSSLNGWIKLHRKYIEEDWYRDPKQRNIYIHLLITAAHEPTFIRGIYLRPGQTVTTVSELVKVSGMTTRQVRTGLKRLEQNHLVTSQTTNRFTVINIENWAFEQGYVFAGDKPNDKQRQADCQTKRQTDDSKETLKIEPIRASDDKGNDKPIAKPNDKQEIYNKKNNKEEREPPTLKDVKSYFLEKNYKSDPALFFSRYAGMGWKINGTPIEDWRYIADSWEIREKNYTGNAGSRGMKPIEPPKYRTFEPEPEIDSVGMPDEIRESINKMFSS